MNPHPAFAGRGPNGEPKLDIIRFITGGYWLDDRHVLHGPNVTYIPLPEAITQPFIAPRLIIEHSQSGPRKTSALNLLAYWRRKDVSGEAHTITELDGRIVQAMPFNRRADCNWKANSWVRGNQLVGALSNETQDNGAGSLTFTPWPLPQFTAMANMGAVQCIAYRIACTAPATWDGTGLGHHSLFREWSTAIGKTCPGAARIRQMDELRRQVTERVAAFYQHAGGTCP